MLSHYEVHSGVEKEKLHCQEHHQDLCGGPENFVGPEEEVPLRFRLAWDYGSDHHGGSKDPGLPPVIVL